MGLKTTHNCWSGPYSSFHYFRIRLAKEIGLDLVKMEGFCEDEVAIPWSIVEHPIVPLLFHSDCDGELTVEECKQVAEGLTQIIKKLPDPVYPNDVHEKHYGLRGRAIQFRDGCLDAIEKNEPVIFG